MLKVRILIISGLLLTALLAYSIKNPMAVWQMHGSSETKTNITKTAPAIPSHTWGRPLFQKETAIPPPTLVTPSPQVFVTPDTLDVTDMPLSSSSSLSPTFTSTVSSSSSLLQLYEPLSPLPTMDGRFIRTPTPPPDMVKAERLYEDILGIFSRSGVPRPSNVALPVTSTEYGAQINGCDGPADRMIALAKELGLRWVKQQVRWGDLATPEKGMDWTCVDAVVRLAQQFDMKVMLSATTAPVHLRRRNRVTGPPIDNRAWHEFISSMAQRYRGRIHAIEMWNEPNLSAEWDIGPDPDRYGELLTIGYLAAKSQDPNILVILGGLAPLPDSRPPLYVSDLEFLDRMAKGKVGLLGYDCLGVHANGPPDFGFVPDVIRRYGDFYKGRPGYPQRPLCITEFSYSIPIDGLVPDDFKWAANHTEKDGAQQFAIWLPAITHSGLVSLAIVFNIGYHDGITPNSIAAVDRPGLRGDILAVIRSYMDR